jgi:hypothetical protein
MVIGAPSTTPVVRNAKEMGIIASPQWLAVCLNFTPTIGFNEKYGNIEVNDMVD